MLVAKGEDFLIIDSDAKASGARGSQGDGQGQDRPIALDDHDESARGVPQLFLDAWRLERDYFYDRNMHGLDWKAMRDRYLPLVDRVADRQELNDVIAQMVSELSALHIFVLWRRRAQARRSGGSRHARRGAAARRKGRRLRGRARLPARSRSAGSGAATGATRLAGEGGRGHREHRRRATC